MQKYSDNEVKRELKGNFLLQLLSGFNEGGKVIPECVP